MSEKAPPDQKSEKAPQATELTWEQKEKGLREDFQKQLKEQQNKYLYLYAEFENFKRRVQKELDEVRKFGWENVALDLVHVIDNMERALDHAKPEAHQALVSGLKMVLNQFSAALGKGGVAPIETEKKPFDPQFHEAVGRTPSDLPENMVSREETRGYTLHGRLLRPSRVILSEGKEGAPKGAGDT